MCKYVNNTNPSRNRPYSDSIGSFTFNNSSAPPQTSSTDAILAPARS